MKNIAISVNGGGALGIGPLAFMCRLESDTAFVGQTISKRSSAFAAGASEPGYVESLRSLTEYP